MTGLISTYMLLWALIRTTHFFVGPAGEQVIPIDSGRIGHLLDAAYDNDKKLLYTYSSLPDGEHISRWAMDGHLLADWPLPKTIRSSTALCLYQGQVTLPAYDEMQKKPIYVTVPSEPSGWLNLKPEKAGDSATYERDRVVKQLREILHNLHWLMLARPGIHVLYADTLIDDFMPTMPYRDERIAWTADYSVISSPYAAEHSALTDFAPFGGKIPSWTSNFWISIRTT